MLALLAQVRDEIGDLRVVQRFAVGRHALAAIVNLVRHLPGIHALAHKLQIGAAFAANTFRTVATRAAAGGEKLRATCGGLRRRVQSRPV